MKAPPAFQFYPADFLVGTAGMTAEEVGAYIRLLCYQWCHGGLPDDDQRLAMLGQCDGNAVASIRHKFGICQDGKLRNARMEEIREGQESYRNTQKNNADKRWKKWVGNANAYATALPMDMPNACSSSSSSSSVAAVAAAAEPSAGEGKADDPVFDALTIAGIGEPKRGKLAAAFSAWAPDAAERLIRAKAESNREAGKRIGALVRTLEAAIEAEDAKGRRRARAPAAAPAAVEPPAVMAFSEAKARGLIGPPKGAA